MYCYISLKYVVVKVHFMTKYIVQLTVTLVIDSVISVADNFTDKLFYDCVLLCMGQRHWEVKIRATVKPHVNTNIDTTAQTTLYKNSFFG